MPLHPRLLFMGTPEFALPTLKALIDHGYPILSVVTQPDRPRGRGKKASPSPVKLLALENGLGVLQPERISNEGFCRLVEEKRPDVIVVVAFGQLLRKNLLSIPKWGVINIHASVLPKYRGAAPIQWAVLNNESETGLTVMRMDEGMDTGPILYQEDVAILADETAGELHDRLAVKAGALMIQSLRRMAESPIRENPQDHSGATYAPKIGKELCGVDWTQPASKVSAHIRALDPRPGAVTLWQGEEMKLFSSRVLEAGRKDVVPGRVAGRREGGLMVETGQGIVEIREVQAPGRKRMPSVQFLRGFALPEGSVLGK